MATDLAAQKARIKEQQEKLARRLGVLTAKEKAGERKRDTRRKIVVGGAVLDRMEKDPAFAATIRALLASAVGRPHDREVIADLLPPASSNAAPPAPANDATSHLKAAAQILDSTG